MGWTFWMRRFALALLVAGVVLFVAQLAKGHAAMDAATHALLWVVLSATVFVAVGYFRYRRNPACMTPRSR